ncbi:Fur family ferric uptake transcriptional regulator [Paraburkholderia sp. GAS199]|uniref:Fur family transcriptional regulator n=1 Tax=Paraburkholderia sp. GAS199 TaxID=3035126 RepID=UPI003D20DBFC
MHTHKILERVGLRPTSPRATVLEFFSAHAHEHYSAEQVYKLLNGDSRSISMATVYRVLGQLVDAHLVSAVTFGDGRTVYELDDGVPHDHIVCTACGEIDEFFDAQIEARQKAIVDARDFTVSGRQLVLFGICSACKKAGVLSRTVYRGD